MENLQQINYKALAIDFCNAVKTGDYPFICQSKADYTLQKIDFYDVQDFQDYQIITTFVSKVGF